MTNSRVVSELSEGGLKILATHPPRLGNRGFTQLTYEASVRLGEIQETEALSVLLKNTHRQSTASVGHDVAATAQNLFKLALLLAYGNRLLGGRSALGNGKNDCGEPYASLHENLHLTSGTKRQVAEMVHRRAKAEQTQPQVSRFIDGARASRANQFSNCLVAVAFSP
ncbi:MAG: hypothetical protein ACK4F5_00965 [Aliihoeflea sp.]